MSSFCCFWTSCQILNLGRVLLQMYRCFQSNRNIEPLAGVLPSKKKTEGWRVWTLETTERDTRGMGEASPEAGGSAAGQAPPRKGKSCKGCLYYSSVLKSRGYNPICVGIPRSIPQVPSYVVDEPKEEVASQGHDLRKFRYGCAGYSMFVDNRDGQGDESDGRTLLPYCRGIELLVDSRLVERKPLTAEQAPAYVSKDASTHSHQQGQQRPADLARQEFMGRFKRSAGLVASGVVKNLNRTASYVKGYIEDIVYPDRRPPK